MGHNVMQVMGQDSTNPVDVGQEIKSTSNALWTREQSPVTAANQLSVSQGWSSSGASVAQNTVLLSIPDITPYTFFSLDNASGFNVKFQISLDGVNYRDVSMVDTTALTGDTVTATTLATGKVWTRGIKGVSARILAFDAASQIYAASTIQLAAGVGAP